MALASCYDLGLHVQPDGKESIRWLTEAANQDYAPAQYELGRIYLYGRGVPIDYAKALLWERKAAEQGDPRAQRDLAFMYERGFGVQADPAQAAEWNRKAAAQGQPDAQLHLAQALDEGVGVSKDAEEARKWYAKAARQQQPTAQLELARELAGQGNCPVAVHWYEEAAGHGAGAGNVRARPALFEQQMRPRQEPGIHVVHDWGKVRITGEQGGSRADWRTYSPRTEKARSAHGGRMDQRTPGQ